MIFITDGGDNRGHNYSGIEDAALAVGAEVFVVGVEDVATETLEAIATDPDPEHLFYTKGFSK